MMAVQEDQGGRVVQLVLVVLRHPIEKPHDSCNRYVCSFLTRCPVLPVRPGTPGGPGGP